MAKLAIKTFTDLSVAQARFKRTVDAEAERLRSGTITAAPGQSMAYEAKHREAERYPQGNLFPFLEAEAEALGLMVQEVASSILAARLRWETLGPRIEGARLKAKKLIGLAGTAAEMHKITQEAFRDLTP